MAIFILSVKHTRNLVNLHRSLERRKGNREIENRKLQHSNDTTDLHIHEMSVLCDGVKDCYSNPALDDESFPYCGSSFFRICQSETDFIR